MDRIIHWLDTHDDSALGAIALRTALLLFGAIVIIPSIFTIVGKLDLPGILQVLIVVVFAAMISSIAHHEPHHRTIVKQDVNSERLLHEISLQRDEIAALKTLLEARGVQPHEIERATEPTQRARVIAHLKANPADKLLTTRELAAKIGEVSHMTVARARRQT